MKDLLRNPNLWVTLAITVLGIIGSLLIERYRDSPDALPIAFFPFVCLLAVAWWTWRAKRGREATDRNRELILDRQRRLENLRDQFDICETANELMPEALGFQRVTPGFDADIRRRPFYATYVARQIVPVDEFGVAQAGPILFEADLRRELMERRGFVILGPPTMGKSRTLFEIVRGLIGWTVVAPKRDEPTPSRETFEELFSDKDVVLILEDLNDFADATIDLVTFYRPNGLGCARRWAVAATCRDGPELGAVKEARGRSLRRFYDEIRPKVVLMPLTDEEKRRVALGAGQRLWDSDSADDYPTPGTIVMEDALMFMRGRFDALSADCRDVLRAIRLLTEAGVLPLFHDRIRAVVGACLGGRCRTLVTA